jgi:hypothetical protein
MSQEKTYAGVLGDLTRLNAAVTANGAELTHLEGPRARLEKLVSDALEVAKQQAALTASKQEASKRLLKLLTEAQRVATGLRKLLKEHYGVRSEKLAEFGLQPFRGRPRKAKPENPAPPETPSPPAPTPAATSSSDS